MAALPEIEKQWQEGANLIRNKERGIVQNRYESISLKPAEFQLCVTREEFARLWKSSLRENTLQALGWAHLLESPNWLYKKWKSQLPKLCQARLENFVGTGSHIPCWSYQEIIDIKETCLKERLVSLFSTTHLPALLFTLLLSIELNKLLFVCVCLSVWSRQLSPRFVDSNCVGRCVSEWPSCCILASPQHHHIFICSVPGTGGLVWFQALGDTE